MHFHTLHDGRLGILVVILPLLGGGAWLYNAYRLGRLKWKPKAPANPRLVTLVLFLFIFLAITLMATIT